MASTQKNDAASLAQEEKRKKKSTKSTLKNFNSNKKSSLFEKDFNSEISTTPRKSNRYRKFSKSSIQMEHNVRVSSNINIHNQKNRKSLIDKLRILRQDAFDQHLFSTAALWGDKIKNLTGYFFLKSIINLDINIMEIYIYIYIFIYNIYY